MFNIGREGGRKEGRKEGRKGEREREKERERGRGRGRRREGERGRERETVREIKNYKKIVNRDLSSLSSSQPGKATAENAAKVRSGRERQLLLMSGTICTDLDTILTGTFCRCQSQNEVIKLDKSRLLKSK